MDPEPAALPQELPGYLSPLYARSLAEFGSPRSLPCCRGWVLERAVPGTSLVDAMGCYPLFCCRRWEALEEDLAVLADELVSVTLVTDPFGDWTADRLRRAFPDRCFPFKDHIVDQCARPLDRRVSKHHRYYARRALREVEVELCERPAELLPEWLQLYACLIQRRQLKGIQAFSPRAFAVQLQVPGLLAFRARHAGETVAAQLWLVQESVAYNHLAACSEAGYRHLAAYALYWESLSYLAGRVDWVDLGASAGPGLSGSDGLSRFKRGWAGQTRPVYLCGRVFNRHAYDALAARTCGGKDDYFPAYRRGELCQPALA